MREEAHPARRRPDLLVAHDEPQQLEVPARCEQRVVLHAPLWPPWRRPSSTQETLHSTENVLRKPVIKALFLTTRQEGS